MDNEERYEMSAEERFLNKYIFQDLTETRSVMAMPTILDRMEEHGIGVYGYEFYVDGEYCGCDVLELHEPLVSTDPRWYRTSIEKCMGKEPRFTFSIVYHVPEAALEWAARQEAQGDDR